MSLDADSIAMLERICDRPVGQQAPSIRRTSTTLRIETDANARESTRDGNWPWLGHGGDLSGPMRGGLSHLAMPSSEERCRPNTHPMRPVPSESPDVPEFVDWVAGTLIALAGIVLTTGGRTLSFVIDRSLLEEGVESGRITVIVVERELTQAEMFEVTLDVVNWTGWGLLVTGIGLTVFAIGYVALRHRVHRRTPEDGTPGTYRS